ncbi:phosphate/phosphite/phosphonate ABC transporter substrate-binding protein [Gallionella capsiferriformans]|uniref:Periplasmic binding protein-related protein n=1 Tax=Gallionella capsiferriformans (strain ES-2) TaxID=395494 RepID=D9SDN7_GALCS|nr:phosphate/phosphite/phosphonate ABC transporter substrate-binding protein [Gallionella capsiferriformans]ADL54794.1 periplasmic binding protein-related protein [Gallionella capsiferriformans ES-2]
MIKKFCSLALLLSTIGLARAAPPIQTLSVGIVPQQSVSRLAEEWGPLLAEVSRRSGVTLVFRTAPGIPVFEERLVQGDYDLAYMNPYHYVIFHKSNGYQAFAKEQDRKIRGILVVKKDSRYHKLADLKGRTVVFPAPAAFAASILPQAEFSRRFIPVEAKFVASHDSVYRAVAAGLHEAGGGIQRTFEACPPEICDSLRILSETKAYTPHAFAAHPRVSAQTLARVQSAMISLGSDETGQRLLAPLAFKGISAAHDKEWNDIRALDIELLKRDVQP